MTSRLAESPAPAPSRLRAGLLCLLMILPLIVGAFIAGAARWEPSQAWSAEATSAPSDEVSATQLADALRAANEAKAQAGFLKNGTKQLADGTGELKGGADELGGGVDKLAAGSQELYEGLVQLQTGTANLGAGATQLADGVGGAVDQIVGLGVVQGQILTAIDGTLKDLEGDNSAEAKNIKSQLTDLRTQVNNFKLDKSMTDQLTQAKNGSRDLANQLSVQGYAYHDGVNSAVGGAKQLNEGLGKLEGNVGHAVEGVDKLNQGAAKIDTMAQQNQAKVEAFHKAMPAATVVAAAGEEIPQRLSPIVALLIAAIVMVGGGFLGVTALRSERRWLVLLAGVVGLAALAEVLLVVLATGLTPVAAAQSGVAAALAAALAAGMSAVLVRFAGVSGGVLAAVLGLLQLGFVGWVWKQAADAVALSAFWRALANLCPLQWATSSLTAAGNAGDAGLLWTGIAILGVAAAAAVGVMNAPIFNKGK